MVHVVDVGEFVENDVIAEGFRDVHEADVEGDGASTTAAAPTGAGVGEAEGGVAVAVLLGPKV